MGSAVSVSAISYFPLSISNAPSPALTERDLTTLWQDQSFPPQALVTTRGEPLRVIYRGRRVGGPGPDFRDAMIAAPRGLLQGDVELHVRSSDFRRHGHARDPAYNNVVLHLVFQDDDREDTLLESGQRVAVAAFQSWVAGRAQEIHGWLKHPGGWREPCFSAVTRLGGAAARETLDRLGDMRFRQKAAIFARRLKDEDAEELLWAGMLEALCYGAQRDALSLLAQMVPWKTLRSQLLAMAARDRAGRAQFLLTDALAKTSYEPAAVTARPGNRPVERLAGAAQLAARFTADGLLPGLSAYLDGDPDEARRTLTRFLTVAGAIGRARSIELLTNAVLPLLAALGPEAQSRRAEALYHLLPLSARYGPVRHLHQALAAQVPINTRRQQGMLYLLKQYCTQGGCGRCPLS